MFKSGLVIRIDKRTSTGIIETFNNRGVRQEFFFYADQCLDGLMPPINSWVTFTKDPDYKDTNVAMLVERFTHSQKIS